MTGFCEAELEGVKRGKNVYTFHMQNQKNKLTHWMEVCRREELKMIPGLV